MIDFATLTGAARVAVGTELPALFANDDTLRDNFIAAGHDAADPLWPLPLHEDYDRYLDGGYAALSSTGTSRYGGARLQRHYSFNAFCSLCHGHILTLWHGILGRALATQEEGKPWAYGLP